MRHTTRALILILVCGCASQPRPDVEVPSAARGDHASLIAAAQDFLRAFDNMEWERFHASWSRDPSVFFPFTDTPERVEGVAVATRFRQFFDDVTKRRKGPPYLHLEPRGLRAEVFGSSGVVTFMLGRPPSDVGRRTLLFVIENGEWKLAHLHASVVEAPAR